MPLAVDQLAPLLQDNYSVQLYGEPGRVDAKSLRVVWLPLLPPEALRLVARLGGVCKYTSGYPWRPFFTGLDLFANPLNAMWVSWDRGPLGGFPVANHSWVEVTHCPQGHAGHKGFAWQFGPMWLYAAPGSGVSINVGRTAVMSHSDAARLLRRVYPSSLECACSPGCEFGLKPGSPPPVRNGSSCIRHYSARHLQPDEPQRANDSSSSAVPRPTPKSLERYERCLSREDVVAELDTIQIFDHQEYFSRERRHEIVRLRHDGECARLEPSTPNLMCGRFPHLRRCPPNSTALQRVGRCVTGKTLLGHELSRAINFTGGRCTMTSIY